MTYAVYCYIVELLHYITTLSLRYLQVAITSGFPAMSLKPESTRRHAVLLQTLQGWRWQEGNDDKFKISKRDTRSHDHVTTRDISP
jgi:hypothetical protein